MVMTSDGMLRRATSEPLIHPQIAPTANAPSSAIGHGTPACARRQKAAVPSAMIEGNDRSISPVMTTKVSARAMMPNCGVVCANAL